MYLRFLDDLEKQYKITGEVSQLFSDRVSINQSDIPENTSGFEIVNDDGTVTSYSDYNVVYRKTEDNIVFTSDTRTHYVYYIFNADGYVSSYILATREVNKPNTIFVRSGKGSFYENVPTEEYLDENGIYKYKVVDEKIVDVTEDEKDVLLLQKIQNARNDKISVLSFECGKRIENGIEYNGKRLSNKLEDQSNLVEAIQKATDSGLSVPYHANGCSYELFSLEQLKEIKELQYKNSMKNKIYFNQMKLYINTLAIIEDIENIYYGQELEGEYLDKYNELIISI